MGIFGGVQSASIACSLVRTKLVALWIGATGVGLFGLYNSALEMINTLCEVGMRQSAVRDLAAAEPSALPRMVAVVRRMARLLALAGAAFTIAAAPALSQWTFGDFSHSWGFVLLAVAVALTMLSDAESAVFQGLQRLQKLARASIYGIVAGLLVSIPLFWFLRIHSIVPSIVAYALATAGAMWWQHEHLPDPPQHLNLRQTFSEARQFMTLGLFMTISLFVNNLMVYIFMAWLNHRAGTDTVGYYQAGYTLSSRYLGLVLGAISMEYYPRLSAAAGSARRMRAFVSNEIVVVLLVMVPLCAMLVGCAQWVIRLLYTEAFLVAVPFVVLAALGTVMRAVSWCLAFTILARGDGRTYVVSEVTSGAISLVLNMVCYHYWGLPGLGIAYTLWLTAFTLMVGWIYYHRYGLRLSAGALWATAAAVLAVSLVVLLWWVAGAWTALAAAVLLAAGSTLRLRKMLLH